MARAYSKDLRDRVLRAVDSGESPEIVGPRFSITSRTIYLWQKQRRIRGHSEPIRSYQKRHSHKIKDLEVFKAFVLKNKDLTCKEMAKVLGKISQSSVRRYLHKLNMTHKKNHIWIYQPKRR